MRRLKESVCLRRRRGQRGKEGEKRTRRTHEGLSELDGKGSDLILELGDEGSGSVGQCVQIDLVRQLEELCSVDVVHQLVLSARRTNDSELTLNDPADVGHHSCANILVAHELGEGDGGLDADGEVGVGDTFHDGAECDLKVLLHGSERSVGTDKGEEKDRGRTSRLSHFISQDSYFSTTSQTCQSSQVSLRFSPIILLPLGATHSVPQETMRALELGQHERSEKALHHRRNLLVLDGRVGEAGEHAEGSVLLARSRLGGVPASKRA